MGSKERSRSRALRPLWPSVPVGGVDSGYRTGVRRVAVGALILLAVPTASVLDARDVSAAGEGV